MARTLLSDIDYGIQSTSRGMSSTNSLPVREITVPKYIISIDQPKGIWYTSLDRAGLTYSPVFNTNSPLLGNVSAILYNGAGTPYLFALEWIGDTTARLNIYKLNADDLKEGKFNPRYTYVRSTTYRSNTTNVAMCWYPLLGQNTFLFHTLYSTLVIDIDTGITGRLMTINASKNDGYATSCVSGTVPAVLIRSANNGGLFFGGLQFESEEYYPSSYPDAGVIYWCPDGDGFSSVVTGTTTKPTVFATSTLIGAMAPYRDVSQSISLYKYHINSGGVTKSDIGYESDVRSEVGSISRTDIYYKYTEFLCYSYGLNGPNHIHTISLFINRARKYYLTDNYGPIYYMTAWDGGPNESTYAQVVAPTEIIKSYADIPKPCFDASCLRDRSYVARGFFRKNSENRVFMDTGYSLGELTPSGNFSFYALGGYTYGSYTIAVEEIPR